MLEAPQSKIRGSGASRAKVYGDADPALSYQVSGLKFSDSEVQLLSRLLARVAGEDVGTYRIAQDTLAASANYTLSFTGADLTITPYPSETTFGAGPWVKKVQRFGYHHMPTTIVLTGESGAHIANNGTFAFPCVSADGER